MEEKLYTHIFRDETSNGILSSNTIQTGAGGGIGSGGEISTGSDVATVFGKVAKTVASKTIMQPLNQATGGLAGPAISFGKAIFKGAGAGGVAGAGAALVFKGFELIVNKIQADIEELKEDARKSNNNDNVLISAGRLNVSNATINYDKYGKARYNYDRS